MFFRMGCWGEYLDLREQICQEYIKVQNDELPKLYSLQNIVRMAISRRMRWAEHVTCRRLLGNGYKILVGMPEGKRPL
jgi:hypothetical protein